jgi:hypothetical protein
MPNMRAQDMIMIMAMLVKTLFVSFLAALRLPDSEGEAET